MDYQSELTRLQSNEAVNKVEYWKPRAGQYKVKALSELEEGKPYVEEGKPDQLRKQLHILVLPENKEVVWSMPHGVTRASTSGQLVNLAVARGNKLKGEEFTVVVVGEGQNKRFTIVG